MNKIALMGARAWRLCVTALLLFVVNVAANAYDFYVGGIYYNITSSANLTVDVTYYSREVNDYAYTGRVVIPTNVEYDGVVYAVTGIGDNAFRYCGYLNSVAIPNSVESIETEAFYYCTKLTAIAIPNSVESIGAHAFCGCMNLEQVAIGNSVAFIGGSAFDRCSSLTKFEVAEANNHYCSKSGVLYTKGMKKLVRFPQSSPLVSFEIPSSVTSIEEDAFFGCNLTTMVIPNSVKSIGKDAFAFSFNLEKVIIGNAVRSIGESAFEYCSSLKELAIGNSVESIGKSAFGNCKSLSKVLVPNSVMSIRDFAFRECKSIVEVTIGKSLTSVGDRVFEGCTSITAFEVAKGSNYYASKDGVLYSKDMKKLILFPLSSPLLPSFDVPNTVIEIGNYAFDQCKDLAEVKIPSSVTTIGIGAFVDCYSLEKVIIGKSVTSIEDAAFYACSALNNITSLNPQPPECDEDIFDVVSLNTCHLYVPEGSREAYSTAYVWKDFENIREIDFAEQEGKSHYSITIIIFVVCAFLLVVVAILLIIIIKLFRKTRQQESFANEPIADTDDAMKVKNTSKT